MILEPSVIKEKVEGFLDLVRERNGSEPEFLQAVEEVAETVVPYIVQNDIYHGKNILLRMVEPERAITFRVNWVDDSGEIQVNRGYRIQMNSAIGPYKGGLRFHPSVNMSILKFLAFEQVFKNSLTTLPMGGAKGGSDFDPKGKSDNEIMRFCHAFMSELFRHIGPNTDVPAGDIGVGGREIGFLFGMYKKLKNEFTGVLTGKGVTWGGSLIRPEATGYGTVYFAQKMLQTKEDDIKDKTVVISGSGNVAQFAAEKIIQLGGKVITLSDSSGYVLDSDGIDQAKLAFVMDLKNNRRGRIKEYVKSYPKATFSKVRHHGNNHVILLYLALLKMNFTAQMQRHFLKMVVYALVKVQICHQQKKQSALFQSAKILFAPGKASNAGGVATSGLEMTQNSLRYNWSRSEVDEKLKDIMGNIHDKCIAYGKDEKTGYIDYVKGANIAGFVKVADAMLAQGIV